MDELETRAGLPDALRVLVKDYPRDIWESHRNFDALTRFWLDRHLMFRRLHVMLRDEAETYLGGNRAGPDFARQTARLGGFLLEQLHHHHQVEDAHYFPLLSGLEPRLGAGFELLDRDHHALEGHLQALAAAASAAVQGAGAGKVQAAGRDAAGALHRQLDGFGRFLDRHLLDEEDLVIPVILHHAPRF